MKPVNNNQVQKALSPEDMTILSNIETLMAQLKAGGAAEEPVAPAGPEDETAIMAQDGAMDEEPVIDPEKKNKKVELTIVDKAADTNTASDGATASDDTEARIKDVQTEESLKEQAAVGKGLIDYLSNFIKKSKTTEQVHPVLQSINDLALVVKNMHDNQIEQANAMKGILDATGITKQMEIAEKSLQEKQKKAQPVIGASAQQIVDLLAAVVNKTQNTNQEQMYSPSAIVNKNLADIEVLKALTVYKGN